jgi:hypothetical protein
LLNYNDAYVRKNFSLWRVSKYNSARVFWSREKNGNYSPPPSPWFSGYYYVICKLLILSIFCKSWYLFYKDYIKYIYHLTQLLEYNSFYKACVYELLSYPFTNQPWIQRQQINCIPISFFRTNCVQIILKNYINCLKRNLNDYTYYVCTKKHYFPIQTNLHG